MEQELKFEKCLEKLEKIVEDLEAGNIPLEDALKKYEEGVKLSRLCTQKLNQAETKIEQLTRTLNSVLDSEEEETASKKPPVLRADKPGGKKTKKTDLESEDDLLL